MSIIFRQYFSKNNECVFAVNKNKNVPCVRNIIDYKFIINGNMNNLKMYQLKYKIIKLL